MQAVGSSLLTSFLSILKFPYSKNIYGPCAKDGDQTTVFHLPNALNECSADPTNYDLVYLSPLGNPYADNSYFIVAKSADMPSNDPTGVTVPYFTSGIHTNYGTIIARNKPTTTSMPSEKPYSFVNTWYAGPTMTNFCPQNFITKPGTASEFAAALPLPIITSSAIIAPQLWIVSGIPIGPNGINVPSTVMPDMKSSMPGLATTLYIIAAESMTLYIDLNGARGGSTNIYANSSTPIGSYNGGAPGKVFGLFTVKANDILKVHLGSVGDSNIGVSGNTTFDGNGQGGLGTVFGGTNGGGASYITYYSYKQFGKNQNGYNAVFEAALASENAPLICVAAGGGGSGRNAAGGRGGSSNELLPYGMPNEINGKAVNSMGSSGGMPYIFGDAPLMLGLRTNGFSGGGGVQTDGGRSNVPNPYPTNTSCYGHALKPWIDKGINGCSGGGSVSTDIGSGGGGGGGGYYGGGAGGWNGQSKPNNVHGGGGGGSSWSSLRPATPRGANLNLYGPMSQDYGYLVLGLIRR